MTPPDGAYPRNTLWKVSRDGEHVCAVEAQGPLSALVACGRAMPASDPHNGEWEVERVQP